ncbi:MAG: hypothetical protein HXY22_11655 [Alphaproteobacteria bacterium]|nr:hypothetical protein [Alphaproteobacteria bacterium]
MLPKSWSEQAFEYKGFQLWHGMTMVFLIFGSEITLPWQLSFYAALALGIATIAVRRRIEHRWQWRGVGIRQIFGAIYFLGAFSVFAALIIKSNYERVIFVPLIMAIVGIGTFFVLFVLRIVHLSDVAFRAECAGMPPIERPERPKLPQWKVAIGIVHFLAYSVIFVGLAWYFYLYMDAFQSGSMVATSERSEALTDHGNIVYITRDEMRILNWLFLFGFIGIPAWMASTFYLHFKLKIPLLPMPTEWLPKIR